MMQPQLLFGGTAPKETFCDRLEDYFKARPNAWIDGLELARVAGAYAWRSRCSDLRKRGMQIENRMRREGKRVISEYRWIA
jgi:hypothetical protein